MDAIFKNRNFYGSAIRPKAEKNIPEITNFSRDLASLSSSINTFTKPVKVLLIKTNKIWSF